jgi:hypothetical protein
MIDILLRHNNFMRRDTEMRFTVVCSSAHEVLIHAIEDLSVHAVHSPANI